MDWDKVRVFHTVAEAGSFTHAGDLLGLSQSAVSRQVSSLESSLGVILFHRHARGLLLTEQGELLYQTTREVFGKLAIAEAMLRESKERPQGHLKVTSTIALGSNWLAPRVKDFLDAYPEIDVDLILDDRDRDLSMREADVAVRLRAPEQLDLVRRPLFHVYFPLYASKEYLARKGTPEKIEDLDQHDLIAYTEVAARFDLGVNWLAVIGREESGPRKPRLRINNFPGICAAIRSGLGIGPIPEYMLGGMDDENLVRLLPDVTGPRFDVHLVYPEELRSSKRVEVFRDFLVEQAKIWRKQNNT